MFKTVSSPSNRSFKKKINSNLAPKALIDSLDCTVVLEFNVERFRQQQTEAARNDGHDAIYQHGDGVMVDPQEYDQRREDAPHTGTHGV